MVWHRGGDNNQTQFLAALFSYQLLLRYILRYNRRVKKDLASGTDVVYLWDGWWMLEEQELDGETWEARRQYVYGGLYIVEPVVSNLQFTEGPAWMAEGSFLLFSDIPASIIYRWSRQDGLKVWRQKSNNANGNTVDLEGRLVTCEHGSRTVTRTGKAGRVETIAATYQGKRLNSPNDVVVKRDGTIWFTDPPYGIRLEMAEQTANHVFRLDRGAAEPVAVVSDFSRPNGLCFSPDEALLYIADSDKKIHHVRRFRVKPDNTLEGGEVFVTISPGVPDGMRVDRDGRLYSTAGDGVHIFSPEGKLLGKIRTPETAANCTFGGPDGRTLFITAHTAVWQVRLAVAGAAR